MPSDSCGRIGAELGLARLAVALGGRETRGPLSPAKERLVGAAAVSPAPVHQQDVREAADAVLRGVFGLRHLVEAQDRGLTRFWAHSLEELLSFVSATKE